MPTELPKRILSILRALPRELGILAMIFLASTMVFTVSDKGLVFILWQYRPVVAFLLLATGMLLGAGWIAGRRGRDTGQKAATRLQPDKKKSARHDSPYNIFGPMEWKLRVRLTIPVFFTFAIIGPLSLMMEDRSTPVPILTFLLVTVSSGAMSATLVLFGHRKVIMILSFLAWMAISSNAQAITSAVMGPQETPVQPAEQAALVRDAAAQRSVFGVVGIFLMATGYALWIVTISKEGARRRQYQSEIEVAQRIQQRLIPANIVRTDWLEVAGVMVTATDVGGDFFDVVRIGNDRVACMVADVAGHGIGPGILSAMLKSALRSQILHDPSPVQVLDNLNSTIKQVADRNMFVTVAYVLLEKSSSTARIATAGHPPVILRRADGTLEELRTRSLGLGMQEEGHFAEIAVTLGKDESLHIYTDGLTEATNEAGTQFDAVGLNAVLRQVGNRGARECSLAVIQAVQDFMTKQEFRDDATMVTIRAVDAISA